jgi:flagellar basal-body rod protein FlgG
MLKGIYTSASGMEAQHLKQEVLADNLANVNTSGYKAAKLVHKLGAEKTVFDLSNNESIGKINNGTEIYDTSYNFEQGALRQTGNPLDLAISGSGFFSVQDNIGNIAYTRNGNFSINADGYLATQSGDLVLDSGYSPIFLGNDLISQINILNNGNIVINGEYRTVLRPFDIQSGTPIIKTENDKFVIAEGGAQPLSNETAIIKQGFVESSNVSAIKSSTDMIQITRTYEANHNALKTQMDSLDMLMRIADGI